MWQNQSCNARSNHSRLEGRDHWRRHLLDEVWTRWSVVRNQSGSRILWRCTRHWLRHQFQCNAHTVGQQHLHKHRAYARWRRVVGRHDRRQACTRNRLAQSTLDTRVRNTCRSSECTIYCACRPVPIYCARVARPCWCSNFGNLVWWPPTHNSSTRHSGIRLESRCVLGFDHGFGNNSSSRWRSWKIAL